MAGAIVGSIQSGGGTTNAPTITLPNSGSRANGNYIVLIISTENSNSITCTSSLSGTDAANWTLASPSANGSNTTRRTGLFVYTRKIDGTESTPTVTLQSDATTENNWAAMEVSGLASSNPVNATNTFPAFNSIVTNTNQYTGKTFGSSWILVATGGRASPAPTVTWTGPTQAVAANDSSFSFINVATQDATSSATYAPKFVYSGITLGDSVGIVFDLASNTDTVNVSDSSATSENTVVAIADQINVSDSSTTSENVGRTWVDNTNVSDSTTTSENVVVRADMNPIVSDTTTTSENATPLIPFLLAPVSDSISTSENLALRADSNPWVSDTTTTSESIKLLVESRIAVSDTSTTSESISLLVASNPVVSDSSTTSESVQLLIPTLPISVSDSSTTAESILLLDTDGIGVLDSATTGENVVITVSETVATSDTTTTSESIHPELNSFVAVSDSTATSENVSVQLGASSSLTISVADTTTTTESVNLLEIANVSTLDTSATSENAQSEVNSFATVSDTTSVAENIKVELNSSIVVSDASTTSENISLFVPTLNVKVSDSATLTEVRHVSIPGTPTTTSPRVIFLLDGRIAIRLGNNLYMPL